MPARNCGLLLISLGRNGDRSSVGNVRDQGHGPINRFRGVKVPGSWEEAPDVRRSGDRLSPVYVN